MANLTRYSPFDETFDDIFKGFFVRPMAFEPQAAAPQMRMDVKEEEGAYVVHAEIPGVKKEDIKVVDPQSGSKMPAAILTYRAFVAANPSRPETEHALWQLGALYADIDRYVDAAATYVQLVTKFPQTRLDAAFQAGEWYEKKVKDTAKAIAAYKLVPSYSENTKKAADRLAKLSK